MKAILKALNTELEGDSTLVALLEDVEYIHSFENLKQYTDDRYLLFGKIAFNKVPELKTSKIRTGSFQIQVLDRDDNLKVADILEQIIENLHNKKLEISGEFRSLQCEFENELPIFYDNEINYYVGAIYFSFTLLKLT